MMPYTPEIQTVVDFSELHHVVKVRP